MVLLALDLSTTVMGYTLFEIESKQKIDIGYHKFNTESLVERGKELHTFLDDQLTKHNITKFAIEENLKSFRSGGTNASAMLNTSKMNFLCQYLVRYIYKIETIELNVNTARSTCFPGFHVIARGRKDMKGKEVAFEMTKLALGEKTFPKKILKSGPRKGLEVFIDEAMDMADSWVIGTAALNPKPIKIKKIKKK